MRVFLLGAGFSKPEGLPLAGELTQIVLNALRRFDSAWEEIDRLEHAATTAAKINGQPGLASIEDVTWALDVEGDFWKARHHAEIVGRTAGETSYGVSDRVATLQHVIETTVSEHLLKKDREATLSHVSRVMGAVAAEDAVVTLNYDRLAERSLSRLGRAVSFGIPSMGEPRSYPNGVEVLKLHGSIDWYLYPRDAPQLREGTTRLYQKRDVNRESGEGVISVNDGTSVPHNPCFEYDHELVRVHEESALTLHYTNPGIPFAWHPSMLFRFPKRVESIPGLGCVWESGGYHLVHCDEVFVVGCSLSPNDRHLAFWINRAMSARKKPPPKVTLVDPCATRLVESARQLFGTSHVVAITGSHTEVDWTSGSPRPQ